MISKKIIPAYKRYIKYSRRQAEAETQNRHKTLDLIKRGLLPPEELMQFLPQKTIRHQYFQYSGEFAYIFEAIDFLLSHLTKEETQKELVYTVDNAFFQIKIEWEAFKDAALDGMPNQTISLLRKLHEAQESSPKLLPWIDNIVLLAKPFKSIVFVRDGKRLKNAKEYNKFEKIDYIFIECFTPFFYPLIAKENKRGFIPLPKAFYAKMKNTMRLCGKDPKYSKIKFTGSLATYRKLFLYLFLHDNGTGEKQEIDAIDLWECVNPTEIKTVNGKKYLRRAKAAQAFFAKACLLLHDMGKLGYLPHQIKYAPKKVFFDTKRNVYILYKYRINREVKDYRQIGDFTAEREILEYTPPKKQKDLGDVDELLFEMQEDKKADCFFDYYEDVFENSQE